MSIPGPIFSILGIIRVFHKKGLITFKCSLNLNFIQNSGKSNEPILRKWFYKLTGRRTELTFIGLLAELGVQKVESMIFNASSYYIWRTKISEVLLIQDKYPHYFWCWVLFFAFKLSLIRSGIGDFINATWTNAGWYEFWSPFSFKYNWCNWQQSTNPKMRVFMIKFHSHFFSSEIVWNLIQHDLYFVLCFVYLHIFPLVSITLHFLRAEHSQHCTKPSEYYCCSIKRA